MAHFWQKSIEVGENAQIGLFQKFWAEHTIL